MSKSRIIQTSAEYFNEAIVNYTSASLSTCCEAEKIEHAFRMKAVLEQENESCKLWVSECRFSPTTINHSKHESSGCVTELKLAGKPTCNLVHSG